MSDFNIEGIQMLNDQSCVAFLLADNALFYGTGFKILKNQTSGYIPCVRSEYNGHVKLTYFTRGRVPLREFARNNGEAACRTVLESLVNMAFEMRDNGFLSLRNVALGLDTLFVEPRASSIGMVYLPVSISISGQTDLQAYKALYSLCVRALSISPGAQGAFDGLLESSGYEAGDLMFLLECLNGTRPIPAASRTGRSTAVSKRSAVPPESSSASNRQSAYVAYNLLPTGARGTLTFRITKQRTVIGKHPEKADCVVTTSPAVSRTHCMLLIDSAVSLSVSDLGSVNGTYVDGRRLSKGEVAPLAEGAKLRLADVEFIVQRAG